MPILTRLAAYAQPTQRLLMYGSQRLHLLFGRQQYLHAVGKAFVNLGHMIGCFGQEHGATPTETNIPVHCSTVHDVYAAHKANTSFSSISAGLQKLHHRIHFYIRFTSIIIRFPSRTSAHVAVEIPLGWRKNSYIGMLLYEGFSFETRSAISTPILWLHRCAIRDTTVVVAEYLAELMIQIGTE